MAHRPAMAHRFAEAILGKSIPKGGENKKEETKMKLTPERMEEICQALVNRIKDGKGLGPSPGIRPSGHFMPGPMAAKMRTMSLAQAIGATADEMEAFRRNITPAMSARINLATEESHQTKKEA